MYRKQPFLFLLIAIAFLLPLRGTAEYSFQVLTDRPDAIYECNESVTFQFSAEKDQAPLLEARIVYCLSNDGETVLQEGEVALEQGSAHCSGSLSTPGFLRCAARCLVAGKEVATATAGAGINPLDIPPSLPVPEDFDAFWNAQRAALKAIPMNPKVTPIPSPSPQLACFDVQLDCLGATPVSGYYARPADAAPKSLPAVLWMHGAGVDSAVVRREVAEAGMLVFDINAHGIPNGKAREFYTALNTGSLRDYRVRGRESRETCYFLGMYHRILRAFDFLTAQPEWDGQVLFARGSSQGGGQALVAAGLEPRVTALIANVPAMCDHTGQVNGWPRLVPRDADGAPDPVVQQVARYFDAMNFATRTQAEALVSVGFIDDTCRPTSVYAAYNNLPGKKRMLNKPLMKHAFPPEWNQEALAMMQEHIQRMK